MGRWELAEWERNQVKGTGLGGAKTYSFETGLQGWAIRGHRQCDFEKGKTAKLPVIGGVNGREGFQNKGEQSEMTRAILALRRPKLQTEASDHGVEREIQSQRKRGGEEEEVKEEEERERKGKRGRGKGGKRNRMPRLGGRETDENRKTREGQDTEMKGRDWLGQRRTQKLA